MIVDKGNDRTENNTGWNAGLRELADHFQASCGSCGSWFHSSFKIIAQTGQADPYRAESLGSQVREQVQVSQNECAFGNDGHGVTILGQNLQHLAGNFLVPLKGLVGIGINAQRDGRNPIAGPVQLFSQSRSSVWFSN